FSALRLKRTRRVFCRVMPACRRENDASGAETCGTAYSPQRSVPAGCVTPSSPCRAGCGRAEKQPAEAGCSVRLVAFLDVEDVRLELGILLEAFDELLEAALGAVAHVHDTFHALHCEQTAREAHETSQRHVYRGMHHHRAV